MERRPRIKIELTRVDKMLELLGWLTLFFWWGIILYNYSNLPDIIPTHYNASGQVNGYGKKITIILLPIIGTVIFIGMTVLNKYPHIYNYPSNITEMNALTQYTYATKMIRYLKCAIVFIFFLIDLFTYLTAKGRTNGLGYLFLPFMLALFFIPTGYYIVKSFKVTR